MTTPNDRSLAPSASSGVLNDVKQVLLRLVAPCPQCHTVGSDPACTTLIHHLPNEAYTDIRRLLVRVQASLRPESDENLKAYMSSPAGELVPCPGCGSKAASASQRMLDGAAFPVCICGHAAQAHQLGVGFEKCAVCECVSYARDNAPAVRAEPDGWKCSCGLLVAPQWGEPYMAKDGSVHSRKTCYEAGERPPADESSTDAVAQLVRAARDAFADTTDTRLDCLYREAYEGPCEGQEVTCWPCNMRRALNFFPSDDDKSDDAYDDLVQRVEEIRRIVGENTVLGPAECDELRGYIKDAIG